jgi:hypothetical protein
MMAEVFGTGGDPVVVAGVHFSAGETFPPDHHPRKPWTLYLSDS